MEDSLTYLDNILLLYVVAASMQLVVNLALWF